MIANIKHYIFHNGLFYILAGLIAFGLKYHYSHASSQDLEWILRPTTGLVELLSGVAFEKEVYAGYISREQRMIIAPSCAGVNFLIIAFGMAVCSCIHALKSVRAKWIWLCGSLISSYLLTLMVNAIRIMIALALHQANLSFGWLTPERIHRLEGILIYLVFLYVFYLILQKLLRHTAKQLHQAYVHDKNVVAQ